MKVAKQNKLLGTAILLSHISCVAMAGPEFGFENGDNQLFGVTDEVREVLRQPVRFDYDDQWNGVFSGTLGGAVGCATSLGNSLSVQTNGSGNTTLVLNSQSNDGSISAECSLGQDL